MGQWYPPALNINDQIAAGLLAGRGACYADDHIVGHHVWNYLLTWRDFAGDRPPVPQAQPGRTWLPNARILIDRRWSKLNDQSELVTLILALNKGGVYKIFRGDRLTASDTQFSLLVAEGKKPKNAVGHLVDDYDITVDTDSIGIQGKLGWAKQTQMTTPKLIILRLVMTTVGRFFPNLIRSILQKILIVGKQDSPFRFARRLTWDTETEQWCISDDLQGGDWRTVKAIELGVDATSIYVVMSRTFQRGQLQESWDLGDRIVDLAPKEPLHVEQYY